jgi:hypothetical protein
MFLKIIVDVIVVHCFLNGLHLLTTSYSNIMYVNVRRESRTCGIPVPSVFLTGTGIPLEIST